MLSSIREGLQNTFSQYLLVFFELFTLHLQSFIDSTIDQIHSLIKCHEHIAIPLFTVRFITILFLVILTFTPFFLT